MGFYINPPNCTKEEFVLRHGIPTTPENLSRMTPKSYREGKYLPVCLVQNPMFSALGIVFGPSMLFEFTRSDGRPKCFFLVLKENLVPGQGADEVPDAYLGK